MTDLALASAGKLRVVKSYEEALTWLIASGETLPVASVVRQDSSHGSATGANATSAAEATGPRLVTEVGPGTVTVHRRVLVDGFDLAALAYGAPVYLSGTDKTLADSDAGTSEVQTVTITGTPTGGTFTLTFGGQTTAAIAYNATAATVQTALEALSTIRAGNVGVSGSAGGPYTVTFRGDLASQNVAAMTADGASLTGGTSPAVAVATGTSGIHSVLVGRVVPGLAVTLGTAADKLLYLDFPL